MRLSPLVRTRFTRRLPMPVYCFSRPISRFSFLRSGRYLPPVIFRFDLPCQSAIQNHFQIKPTTFDHIVAVFLTVIPVRGIHLRILYLIISIYGDKYGLNLLFNILNYLKVVTKKDYSYMNTIFRYLIKKG